MEEGLAESGQRRGRFAEATPARLRSESSAHPGPAPEGLRLEPELPRQPSHKPAVPRLLHRGLRVDGPAEPLPRGSYRPPVVGPPINAQPTSRTRVLHYRTRNNSE